MKVVVTGAAGFIGSHLSEALAHAGHTVVGIDAFTDFYDVRLKEENAAAATAAGAVIHRLDLAKDDLSAAIDGAEALYQANGITSTATYDTVPMELDVGVLSSSSRRYLEILGKLDQLMPLLQTLEIHEVITTQAVDIERAALKRKVRDVANGTRNLAARLRREMNAMDARRAAGESDATAGSQSAPGSEADVSDGDATDAAPEAKPNVVAAAAVLAAEVAAAGKDEDATA